MIINITFDNIVLIIYWYFRHWVGINHLLKFENMSNNKTKNIHVLMQECTEHSRHLLLIYSEKYISSLNGWTYFLLFYQRAVCGLAIKIKQVFQKTTCKNANTQTDFWFHCMNAVSWHRNAPPSRLIQIRTSTCVRAVCVCSRCVSVSSTKITN